MSKPIIKYVQLWSNRCGLSVDTQRAIMRKEGSANVRSIRPATQGEVDWVRAMGGFVPEGRIQRQREQKARQS